MNCSFEWVLLATCMCIIIISIYFPVWGKVIAPSPPYLWIRHWTCHKAVNILVHILWTGNELTMKSNYDFLYHTRRICRLKNICTKANPLMDHSLKNESRWKEEGTRDAILIIKHCVPAGHRAYSEYCWWALHYTL